MKDFKDKWEKKERQYFSSFYFFDEIACDHFIKSFLLVGYRMEGDILQMYVAFIIPLKLDFIPVLRWFFKVSLIE